jgi:hypothetical protein
MVWMGREHAAILESLRREVLDRLVEIRATIDQAYAYIDDNVIRSQFDVVVMNMHAYLHTDDEAQYSEFLARWAALREGSSVGHEKVIHAVVAIGDVLVRTAQDSLGATTECADFVHSVTMMTQFGAQCLVDLLARELDHRTAQRRAVEAR